ncbi:MAG TPA: hypothetical protein VFY49_02410 [Myxococcota bacterium]|nr:hypothetical protein [Myxococcota bacterium]
MRSALFIVAPMLALAAAAQTPEGVRHYAAPAARQGVAVAGPAFYAIDDRVIEKYDRESGARLARYDAGDDAAIVHLNGCSVQGDVLSCAHSNYPHVPMRSSIERFDARTLAHVGSQPLADAPGSATWVVQAGGSWWVAFAHYAGRGGEPGKGPEHARLVKLDADFRSLASYAYPPELVARFAGRSNSGGVFGADGWLYLTGHDAPELYVACVDDAAHVLRWLATRPAPIEGQGIAWDLATGTFWGVVRDAREVVSFPLAPEGPTPAVAPAPCPPGKAGKPQPPFGR